MDESYQYNANGNRTGTTVGSSSSVYTPGAYNRLESVDDGTTVTVFGGVETGTQLVLALAADQFFGQINAWTWTGGTWVDPSSASMWDLGKAGSWGAFVGLGGGGQALMSPLRAVGVTDWIGLERRRRPHQARVRCQRQPNSSICRR